ncbi:MAG: hypothetical protein LBB75_02165 [Oscillospiraceae bacterium]|jgi:hypothetical protein|nr:hypothetical protein [Oscillospiraceae bacterium]
MKTRKFNALFALIFALALCLSSFTTAFAALDENGALLGTEAVPAQAAITKILQMPKGTDTPNANFVFEVKAVSAADCADPAEAPAITDITISFDQNMAGETRGATKSVPKESLDIFAGKNFPHAGVYAYEITEKQKTNTAIDANTKHEDLKYSPAKYTLKVYVQNKADGSGTYIYAIGDVITNPDNECQKAGDKVDPTPGDNGNGDYSKMIFTNTYVKTNGPTDPDDPDPTKDEDSILSVSKMVEGGFASKELYFNFNLTVTKPALVSGDQTYRAYVVEGNKVLKATEMAANKVTAAGTDDKGQDYIEVSDALTFSLKHGQKLVFIDTPVGTSYEVTEINPTDYKPHYTITTNGTPAAEVAGSLSASLATGTQWAGEATNKAAYRNERDDITPTGLNLNDLPFIGMIALAFGAVAAVAVAKARKVRKMASFH